MSTIPPSLIREGREACLMAGAIFEALRDGDTASAATQVTVGHIRDHLTTASRMLEVLAPPLDTEAYAAMIRERGEGVA